MNIEALVPPEFLEEVYQGLEQLATAGVASGHLHLRTKDGRIVDGEVRATLIMRDGAPYGVRGIMRDQTVVREMEDRLMRNERLATLGRIAASVSHELRNPLGAISNATYFLKMQLAQASEVKVRRHLDIIERQIKIANRIIGDLLNFSRTPTLDVESFPLAPLCMDALGVLTIPDFIEVALDVEPNLMVEADRQYLNQVLQNLISNAVQAMPEGGKLKLRAEHVERQGEVWLEISVADTGIGITREEQEHIFEPLFTTRARGIGLGLTICKSVVEAHGGRIWVESPTIRSGDAHNEEGQHREGGTTFYIDLPLAREKLQTRGTRSQSNIEVGGKVG